MDWTQERIEWIIDGVTVATITNVTAGKGFPQTPGRVTIGVWCPECYGAHPGLVGTPVVDNGTYTATVLSLEVINYNPAQQYSYGDMSGSSGSVVIHQQSTSPSKLTSAEIAGIVIGALAAIASIGSILVYYLRHRGTTRGQVGDGDGHPNSDVRETKGQRIAHDQTMGNFATRRSERNRETPSGRLRQAEEPAPETERRPGGRLGPQTDARLDARVP